MMVAVNKKADDECDDNDSREDSGARHLDTILCVSKDHIKLFTKVTKSLQRWEE